MIVLDTTVAIDILRARPEARGVLRDALWKGAHIGASEVVRCEILSGMRSEEEAATEAFLETMDWVPVTEVVSRTAADLYRRYHPAYDAIDDIDYLIAATALVLDAELLTTNVRHFPMFEGLEPAYV